MHKPKKQKRPLNDLNRSLTPFDPNETLIGAVELSKGSCLVAGIIPGEIDADDVVAGALENEQSSRPKNC